MKYLSLLLVFLSLQAISQDKIVTVNNDTIDCEILYISETHVKYELDGKKRSSVHAYVTHVYDDGQWFKNLYHEEIAEQETIMKKKPELMAKDLSKKQVNHIYSAGRFLDSGSKKIVGGLAVSVLATGVFTLLVDQNSEAAAIIGIGGNLVGLFLTIGGTSDIRKAGKELQAFPYE